MAFQFTAGVNTQMYTDYVTNNMTSQQVADKYGCSVDQLHGALLTLAMTGVFALPASKVSYVDSIHSIPTWLD